MIFCWHISVIQFSRITFVSGVILDHHVGTKPKALRGFYNAIQTSKTYFKKPYSNELILIKLGDNTLETTTDQNGFFSIEFKSDAEGIVEVFTKSFDAIPYDQSYPFFFAQKQVNQLVISDIDDTIMRSFTRTKLKRLITTLFHPARKRKVILSTKNLYKSLVKSDSSFYYVSKSEINLVHIISEFIMHNNLPQGPLFLTPYLNISQLLKNKKDSAFKYLSICYILDHSEPKPVILIGDDTQADMIVYTEIVKKYRDQIKNVYIRQTRHKKSKKQQELWDNLIQTGVNASYFRYDNQITAHQ